MSILLALVDRVLVEDPIYFSPQSNGPDEYECAWCRATQPAKSRPPKPGEGRSLFGYHEPVERPFPHEANCPYVMAAEAARLVLGREVVL